MKKQFRRFLPISPVVLLLGAGTSLLAQQDQQRSGQYAQTELQQDTTLYPSDNPTDRPVAETSGMNSQSFIGTIVKYGGKFVLQADHGNTYDLDHQEAVRSFEGKRVSLQGRLEAKTKLIHLEQQQPRIASGADDPNREILDNHRGFSRSR
jgi:hypothetical protein